MDVAEPQLTYEFSGFRLDPSRRRLISPAGQSIELSSRVFDALLYMVERPGKLLDKAALMQAVWPNTVVEENNLNQVISALRRALGETPGEHRFILTEPGRGYRFIARARTVGAEPPPQEPDPATVTPAPSAPSRAVPRIAAGLVVVLILAGIYQYFQRDRTEGEPKAPPAQEQAVVVAAPPVPKSIAVLPFVNMSPDQDQEYFADGIAEELLNLLARIPQLRVIARTSSFAFKDEKIEIAEIAKKLNVTHVLEGSVRKSGNQVRIAAQLIRASDSAHLGSETYDRSLDDVFAIQDEISAAVVAHLKITLLGAAPMAKATDPAAYVLTMQAQQLRSQTTAENLAQSILLFQQALATAPDYAAAWAGLADSYGSQAFRLELPLDEGYTLAREAAYKALSLDPDNAAAHAQLGDISMFYDGDLAAAARHFERALQLDPANPSRAGSLLFGLGRVEEFLAIAEYELSRDPVNTWNQFVQGYGYLMAGRPDEAITPLRTALSLGLDEIGAQFWLSAALLEKGEPDAALAAMQLERLEKVRLIGLAVVYHALGRAAESDAALAKMIDAYGPIAPCKIALVLAYRGEFDRAFEWLDKAVQDKDPSLLLLPLEFQLTNIHEDPRWLPFLESIGKSPAQLDAIEFKMTLPE